MTDARVVWEGKGADEMPGTRETWVAPVLIALAASGDARTKVNGTGNVDLTYNSGFPAGYS